ncbi:hypothetical protein M0D70_07275 [Acinetobacter portensis]|uniref:Uncharacterized protein n=2 Tax=Acinetobacter TaxID=469 RepID=A0ABU5GLH2_9GAMM|nr:MULTISPECIES: hypothetical protein [Acinetobacter]MCK7609191.1 hypothetical protein [Acinetobacter portensis]MCK7639968.1 hypothetical protein [Acinetobacter portensis]MDY6484605.1 hypothetical protein [Acinetobacter faecalis]MDY6489898.1 hypothetical protein [Acinetobacter faecalis]MDY6531447.1 hypothetical protein [Acinetobacter faecalis]
MSPLDEYTLSQQQIEQGVVVLKKRHRNLMLLAMTTSTVFVASVLSIFIQHDLIYSFFGLSTEVKQLHIVPSLNVNVDQPADYFLSLLSWFGWFILKIFVSFIGAFFVIRFLKKIKYFYIRFQSFVLRFVGWLIAFILLWSSLTYVQYDGGDKKAHVIEKLVKYESNIQESEIAQYLKNNDIAKPIQDYLLAQTALLHKPADKALAMVFTQRLVNAEKNDVKFLEYGFQPEQIWILQNQLYGKSITLFAKNVDKQATHAELISKYAQILIYAVIVLSFIVSLFLFVLASNLKKRAIRIEQRIF